MNDFQLPEPPSEGAVRLVLIGDIVGKPGLRIACNAVPWLRRELGAVGLIANAENAADGSGLRAKDYRRLTEAGIDAITLGDHVFRKREITEVLESKSNIVRPANLAPKAPGKTSAIIELAGGLQLGIVSVLGRVFMNPIDCPFRAVERELEQLSESVTLRLVDFHAEATSDKQLMGRFLDGRVSAVLGTHTHVPTADSQILPGGTAFQCDVGMTGPFLSILGRKVDAVMEATLNSIPVPFQVATGDVRLNASWVDVDADSGRAHAIGRLDIREATINDYQSQIESSKKLALIIWKPVIFDSRARCCSHVVVSPCYKRLTTMRFARTKVPKGCRGPCAAFLWPQVWFR